MGIEQKEGFGIVFSFRKRLFIIKRFVVQEKILKFLTNNEKSNNFPNFHQALPSRSSCSSVSPAKTACETGRAAAAAAKTVNVRLVFTDGIRYMDYPCRGDRYIGLRHVFPQMGKN
jgi:hypothetical protein